GKHELPVVIGMIRRKHDVLNVVFFIAIATQITKVSAINGISSLQGVSPFDVINPASGPPKEHDVAVRKVNVKIIPVEAFSCPDISIVKRSGELTEASH